MRSASAGGLSAGTCVGELGVGCGRSELEELAERIPEAAEVVLEDALVRDGGERVGPLGTPVLDSLTAYTRRLGTLGVPSTARAAPHTRRTGRACPRRDTRGIAP